MSNQRNNSGVQLSSSQWLEAHHNSKKQLRSAFAKKLAERNPASIIDIGCGTGLWLSLFNDILPKSCKFIGVDLDKTSLEEAEKRAKDWDRECQWIALDVNKEPEKLPPADLTLIFNFSSYIGNLDVLFSNISRERGFKEIALRQFAGDEIKFGPFNPDEHTSIDLSLKDSIGSSRQIRYFDMDRLIQSTKTMKRKILYQDFELYKAFSPFDESSFPYVEGTALWTLERVSKNVKPLISDWVYKARNNDRGLYFYSLDWIALLI